MKCRPEVCVTIHQAAASRYESPAREWAGSGGAGRAGPGQAPCPSQRSQRPLWSGREQWAASRVDHRPQGTGPDRVFINAFTAYLGLTPKKRKPGPASNRSAFLRDPPRPAAPRHATPRHAEPRALHSVNGFVGRLSTDKGTLTWI